MFDFSSHKLSYKSVQLDYTLNKSSFLRLGNMKVPGPMVATFLQLI